jgi:N-dimethylarginine dimethylaminohydrolase
MEAAGIPAPSQCCRCRKGACPAVILNPGKPNRRGEAERQREFFLQEGIPILGEVFPPGTAEGGDMVWLDPQTLLMGRGCRTNAGGIEQVRDLLGPMQVEVIGAPLPPRRVPAPDVTDQFAG